MTLKQRRTRLDPVLLRVVLPLLYEAHLTPLTGFTRFWHTAAPPSARPAPTSRDASPAPALPRAA